MKNLFKLTLLLLAFHIGCASTSTPNDTATTTEQSAPQETPQAPKAETTNTTTEVSRPDLRAELIEMFEKDQTARQQLFASGQQPTPEASEKLEAQDIAHARRLKAIIDELGQWPDTDIVGQMGAQGAWIIAQHADALTDLQNIFLKHMRLAVDAGKATPYHYAYLVDRVRENENRPQVYGTQFRPTLDGTMELAPVEEPENLNKRRAEMGLNTIEEYMAEMEKLISQNPMPPTQENAPNHNE